MESKEQQETLMRGKVMAAMVVSTGMMLLGVGFGMAVQDTLMTWGCAALAVSGAAIFFRNWDLFSELMRR